MDPDLAERLQWDLWSTLNQLNRCDPETVNLDDLREAKKQLEALIVHFWMRRRAYAA